MEALHKSTHKLFILVLICIFSAGYYSTAAWMYGRFVGADSYYSHGFLIPFISGYLIWKKWDELEQAPLKGSYWGLALVVFSAILHILGTIIYVFSVSGFSIFFMIIGSSLFLFGRKVTRIILFPLVFLVFMFPLPQAIIGKIAFPLKMFVSWIGVLIVQAFNIPVFREGFYITIPSGQLLVDNPCSGLRSLAAFLALGALFAHMSRLSVLDKWILFFSSFPIAIISNLIRVPMLICVAYFWGLDAVDSDGLIHQASGIFVFAVGLALLFFTGKILEWKPSKSDT